TSHLERVFPRERRSPEMHIEGDPEVLKNLFRKKDLLQRRDSRHQEIKPLLLIGHGAQRGVFGGAQAIALERAGLSDAFDTVVGVSAGAPTAAYFLAGQSALGTSIYYEECASKRFISKRRYFWGERIMNTGYLCDVMRGNESNKKLDIRALRASRPEAFAVATHKEGGHGVFLDMKRSVDPVEIIHASIAVPGVASNGVEIADELYLDGGASPLPVSDVIDEFHPTDILILANRSEDGEFWSTLMEYLFEEPFLTGLPEVTHNKFSKKQREKAFKDALTFIRSQSGCRMAILWTDDKIRSSTQNRQKLRSAAQRSFRYLTKLLKEAKREVKAEAKS
ncbi:MAG: patatin-like phospholipase family protein, partial [bacterium]|nr:patatin-like phospholipase family protein [bacterium]